MKAVLLEQITVLPKVRDIDLNDSPDLGQVRVKILTSGLCGAQLQEIAGLKGNASFVPHLMGHEGCGIVEQIGNGVTKVQTGDKVVVHWMKGTGIESNFPRYKFNNKEITSGKCITLAQYADVSENRITKVHNETPDELGSLLGCSLTTALGIINNEANVKFGESVLVLGCGGVGITCIHAANLACATPVIGVDISNDTEKRFAVQNLGGTFFCNKHQDISSFLKVEYGIKTVDVIIDTTGNDKLITQTLPLLSEQGRYILVAQPKHNVVIPNPKNLFIGSGQSIKATQGGKTNPSEDIPRYVKMFKAGKLRINDIISHYFSLNEIEIGIDLLRKGRAGRIIFRIT